MKKNAKRGGKRKSTKEKEKVRKMKKNIRKS